MRLQLANAVQGGQALWLLMAANSKNRPSHALLGAIQKINPPIMCSAPWGTMVQHGVPSGEVTVREGILTVLVGALGVVNGDRQLPCL